MNTKDLIKWLKDDVDSAYYGKCREKINEIIERLENSELTYIEIILDLYKRIGKLERQLEKK